MGRISTFISQTLNKVFVPTYTATDGEFKTAVGPDGQTKVSHIQTAATNRDAFYKDMADGHYGSALKDGSEAIWHGTWAAINRKTGMDKAFGMTK